MSAGVAGNVTLSPLPIGVCLPNSKFVPRNRPRQWSPEPLYFGGAAAHLSPLQILPVAPDCRSTFANTFACTEYTLCYPLGLNTVSPWFPPIRSMDDFVDGKISDQGNLRACSARSLALLAGSINPTCAKQRALIPVDVLIDDFTFLNTRNHDSGRFYFRLFGACQEASPASPCRE